MISEAITVHIYIYTPLLCRIEFWNELLAAAFDMCLEGVFKFARHRVLSATRAVTYHLSQLPPRVWYSNNQRLKHFGSDQNMQRLIAKIDVWRLFEAIVSHKRAGGRHKRAREVGLFSQSNRFPLHQFLKRCKRWEFITGRPVYPSDNMFFYGLVPHPLLVLIDGNHIPLKFTES